jgi:hypothetical protein
VRFDAGACIGFWFPGAGRSATNKLAAAGARGVVSVLERAYFKNASLACFGQPKWKSQINPIQILIPI